MNDYLDYLIEALHDDLDAERDEIMESPDPYDAAFEIMDDLLIEKNVEPGDTAMGILPGVIYDWFEKDLIEEGVR